MFSRALLRATLRLSSRNNNNGGNQLSNTNFRGINQAKDQIKKEDKDEKTTSKHLFNTNEKDKIANKRNNENMNRKPYYNYRNQGKQNFRQPIEKVDHVYKKGEFNPNILTFTWMPADPNYNLQQFSAHLDKIVTDKNYPNQRCIESWLHIIQRGEYFQPDATAYFNIIHLLVVSKMPIPIDLFESGLKALSPNINYVPSDELKSLADNHKMLFTVIQELLANKTEDPDAEPDPLLAKVSQLFEHIIESTTMLQKSNYAMIALAQMFLMHVPRTTHIWTLLFVSSSALTAEEQHQLFKLLPHSDLALLTSQIMESLFFVSDQSSNETILQRMVELRLKPSSNFCSIYIRKLRDAKDYRRIIAFYQWMRNENIKLDGAITMTSIITACHQTFNLALADSILEDPAYEQIVNSLDTPLLNSLIYHHARKQDVEQVEIFVNKLTRDGITSYRPLVTMPTYHIYLTVLAKYRGSEVAIDTWTQYRKTHSKFRFLSPEAFLSIVSAILKENNIEEAIRFIKRAVAKVDIAHYKTIKAVAIANNADWANQRKNNSGGSDVFLDISTNNEDLTKLTESIFEPFHKYPREELEQLSNLVMRDLVHEKNVEFMWTWFHVMKTKGLLLSFKMLMAVEEIFNELKFNQLASVVAKEKSSKKTIINDA
jgi:hypothetical protein